MSVVLGLRHGRLLREQAVEMFERGCGYGLTARRLGVCAETVREWQKMYRVIGRGGLLAMGVKRARYDYETKVAAARAVVDGGMSKPEAMVRFGIASATPLKNWCRLYREGGAQALKPKPKGRPKGSVRAAPPTREEELQERVQRAQRRNRPSGAGRVCGQRPGSTLPPNGCDLAACLAALHAIPGVPAHAAPRRVHHQRYRIVELPAT